MTSVTPSSTSKHEASPPAVRQKPVEPVSSPETAIDQVELMKKLAEERRQAKIAEEKRLEEERKRRAAEKLKMLEEEDRIAKVLPRFSLL